jgi:hypothetical protein
MKGEAGLGDDQHDVYDVRRLRAACLGRLFGAAKVELIRSLF